MDKSNKLYLKSVMILYLEVLIFYIINKSIFAEIFSKLYSKTLFVILILIILNHIKLSEKLRKGIIILNFAIIIFLPILVVFNLPKYSYKEAVKCLGEIQRNKGVSSFSYIDNKLSSNYNGLNKNIVTGRDYLIEAEVDGKYYRYYFNPYTSEYIEGKVNMSEKQIDEFKKDKRYKTLF